MICCPNVSIPTACRSIGHPFGVDARGDQDGPSAAEAVARGRGLDWRPAPVNLEESGMGSNATTRTRAAARVRMAVSALKARLRKYLSGRLAVVQISAGIGAFIVRSTAAYLASEWALAATVATAMAGSFAGYIAAYAFGYWMAFRIDYEVSGRSMPLDIVRLQIVEQLPNVGTVIASGVTQGALIGGTAVPPVVAVNIGSWFGPQKIVNLAAMLTSNTLKKAWVDGSWKPSAVARGLVGRVRRAGGRA